MKRLFHFVVESILFLPLLASAGVPTPIPTDRLPDYVRAVQDSGFFTLVCSKDRILEFSSALDSVRAGSIDLTGSQPILRLYANVEIYQGGSVKETDRKRWVFTVTSSRDFKKVIAITMRQEALVHSNHGTLLQPDYRDDWTGSDYCVCKQPNAETLP